MQPLPLWGKAVCGLTAGGLGAMVGSPADLTLIRMQADATLPPAARRNYKNVGDALARCGARARHWVGRSMPGAAASADRGASSFGLGGAPFCLLPRRAVREGPRRPLPTSPWRSILYLGGKARSGALLRAARAKARCAKRLQGRVHGMACSVAALCEPLCLVATATRAAAAA
jgi:hypothetical protein